MLPADPAGDVGVEQAVKRDTGFGIPPDPGFGVLGDGEAGCYRTVDDDLHLCHSGTRPVIDQGGPVDLAGGLAAVHSWREHPVAAVNVVQGAAAVRAAPGPGEDAGKRHPARAEQTRNLECVDLLPVRDLGRRAEAHVQRSEDDSSVRSSHGLEELPGVPLDPWVFVTMVDEGVPADHRDSGHSRDFQQPSVGVADLLNQVFGDPAAKPVHVGLVGKLPGAAQQALVRHQVGADVAVPGMCHQGLQHQTKATQRACARPAEGPFPHHIRQIDHELGLVDRPRQIVLQEAPRVSAAYGLARQQG